MPRNCKTFGVVRNVVLVKLEGSIIFGDTKAAANDAASMEKAVCAFDCTGVLHAYIPQELRESR